MELSTPHIKCFCRDFKLFMWVFWEFKNLEINLSPLIIIHFKLQNLYDLVILTLFKWIQPTYFGKCNILVHISVKTLHQIYRNNTKVHC